MCRKVSLPSGFFLKVRAVGKFRYFYAHEIVKLLDPLIFACTKYDLTMLKEIVNITDVIQSCSREKNKTSWKLYKLTTLLTVFAVLPEDIPIGCKDSVLHKTLLKICSISCLTSEEFTR